MTNNLKIIIILSIFVSILTGYFYFSSPSFVKNQAISNNNNENDNNKDEKNEENNQEEIRNREVWKEGILSGVISGILSLLIGFIFEQLCKEKSEKGSIIILFILIFFGSVIFPMIFATKKYKNMNYWGRLKWNILSMIISLIMAIIVIFAIVFFAYVLKTRCAAQTSLV